MQLSVMGVVGVWNYSSVMLQIVVEVAGTVCDADCSIFSQTVDRQPPPTADRSLACQVGRSRIDCCDWAVSLRVGGRSPWWTRSTRVTCTSAAIRRPLGRRRVDRSQSYHGVAARAIGYREYVDKYNKLCNRRWTTRRISRNFVKWYTSVWTSCTTNPQQIEV